MIVRYERPRGYQGEGVDPILTIGRLYVVFSISFGGASQITFISICTDDDNTPSLFDLKYFDVVDGHLSSEWTIRAYENGRVVLQPDLFHGDFWDRYHDGDANAEMIFSNYYDSVNVGLRI